MTIKERIVELVCSAFVALTDGPGTDVTREPKTGEPAAAGLTLRSAHP